MSQRIENSSWESIVRVSTFEEALFESDECSSFWETRVAAEVVASSGAGRSQKYRFWRK